MFANTLLHLTLSSLLCNSSLQLNLLYMIHFACVGNSCSLFSLLLLKPVLSSSGLSRFCSLYGSRKAQMEQAWPAFSWGLKSSARSPWICSGNGNTILWVYLVITCPFSAVHSPRATPHCWIRSVWRYSLPTLRYPLMGLVRIFFTKPLNIEYNYREEINFFRDKLT